MSLSDTAPPETLSLAKLSSAVVALKTENLALRDEVARLKALPPRPPSRPSGMQKSTGGSARPGKSAASAHGAGGAPSGIVTR